MSYEDLISRIVREIPGLAGKLSAPRATYVKSLKKTYITFESTELVGEKEFLQLERILREVFPGRPLAVRVVSPALRDHFLQDIGAYRRVLTDFLRVIPACIAGSAVGGGLSVAYGCTLMAPHGGLFVFPVVENSPMYLLALTAGSLVTALVLGALKKPIEHDPLHA